MKTSYFATELRYLGKGQIVSVNREDDTAIVTIEGMGTGRVNCEQIFETKREALAFATVPQSTTGWSSAARLLGNVQGSKKWDGTPGTTVDLLREVAS